MFNSTIGSWIFVKVIPSKNCCYKVFVGASFHQFEQYLRMWQINTFWTIIFARPIFSINLNMIKYNFYCRLPNHHSMPLLACASFSRKHIFIKRWFWGILSFSDRFFFNINLSFERVEHSDLFKAVNEVAFCRLFK